jgi:hypothetical protein
MVAADIAAAGLADLVAMGRGGMAGALSTHLAMGALNVWRFVEIAMKVLDCIKIAESGAKAFTSGMEGFNVIDPKGPMPSLAGGMSTYAPPVRSGGKAPAFY